MPSFDVTPSDIVMNVDPSVKKVRPYIVCGIIRDIDLDEEEVATLMTIQEHLHWDVHNLFREMKRGIKECLKESSIPEAACLSYRGARHWKIYAWIGAGRAFA